MARYPKGSIWDEACEMLERAERLQRQFFRPARGASPTPAWEPPIDVYEWADWFVVIVALPGVRPEAIRVLLDAGSLVVQGRRELPRAARQGLIRRMELPHGRFERRVDLPPGHYELSDQEHADGCLTLALRKLAREGV